MIDIHCHILPNMDDGAQSMAEALEMARLAVQSGVTDIIATPHFPADMLQEKLPQKVLRTLEQFQKALEKVQIPLKVHPGAEILCLPDAVTLARQGQLPTLGQGHYLLTEFFFDESIQYIDQTLHELSQLGYTPIIAHPERYHAIQQNIRIAEDWFFKGYLMQVNKGSILGAFGGNVQAAAEHLLHHGLAHVLASDAHHSEYRTPHMQQLYHWALEQLGSRYTHILLQENPSRILQGLPPVPIQ